MLPCPGGIALAQDRRSARRAPAAPRHDVKGNFFGRGWPLGLAHPVEAHAHELAAERNGVSP
jgi:hypothetical protein